jgi:hypothetical protein
MIAEWPLPRAATEFFEEGGAGEFDGEVGGGVVRVEDGVELDCAGKGKRRDRADWP